MKVTECYRWLIFLVSVTASWCWGWGNEKPDAWIDISVGTCTQYPHWFHRVGYLFRVQSTWESPVKLVSLSFFFSLLKNWNENEPNERGRPCLPLADSTRGRSDGFRFRIPKLNWSASTRYRQERGKCLRLVRLLAILRRRMKASAWLLQCGWSGCCGCCWCWCCWRWCWCCRWLKVASHWFFSSTERAART